MYIYIYNTHMNHQQDMVNPKKYCKKHQNWSPSPPAQQPSWGGADPAALLPTLLPAATSNSLARRDRGAKSPGDVKKGGDCSELIPWYTQVGDI